MEVVRTITETEVVVEAAVLEETVVLDCVTFNEMPQRILSSKSFL